MISPFEDVWQQAQAQECNQMNVQQYGRLDLLHVPKQGRHPALWHPDEWLYHIYKGDQDSENGQSQEDQGKQNGTSPASSKFYKL